MFASAARRVRREILFECGGLFLCVEPSGEELSGVVGECDSEELSQSLARRVEQEVEGGCRQRQRQRC